MAKTRNYKKTLGEFRESMERMKGVPMDEAPEFEQWLDTLEGKLQAASHEALEQLPDVCKEKGFAEAFFTGLARFTCRILQKMERQGMFADGWDGYGFYTQVLMPVCNDLVKAELDAEQDEHDTATAIALDVVNPDITLDEILRKHFAGREAEWPEIRKTLEDARRMASEDGKEGLSV